MVIVHILTLTGKNEMALLFHWLLHSSSYPRKLDGIQVDV
jgi:hypothetical protein